MVKARVLVFLLLKTTPPTNWLACAVPAPPLKPAVQGLIIPGAMARAIDVATFELLAVAVATAILFLPMGAMSLFLMAVILGPSSSYVTVGKAVPVGVTVVPTMSA